MQPLFLRLDEALNDQHRLREAALAQGLLETGARDLGPALRLWSRTPALDALAGRLRDALRGSDRPLLAFAGSGDFHHVSPLLIERAVALAGQPLTILHIDNHPDWVRFRDGMHCGSWVARAARLPGVARVITVGVCSNDIGGARARQADLALLEEDRLELYPYHTPDGEPSIRLCGREWPSIASLGEDAFIELLLSRIPTRAVYVTLDKDVLDGAYAVTNWDQGCATLEFVSELIRQTGARHVFAGADVVGDWSAPRYAGFAAGGLKWAEALLDQPWRAPGAAALRVNEDTNLHLLGLFAEVAP